MPILKLLLLSLVLVLIAVLALSVRLLFNKKILFKGRCGSHAADAEGESTDCCCTSTDKHEH